MQTSYELKGTPVIVGALFMCATGMGYTFFKMKRLVIENVIDKDSSMR